MTKIARRSRILIMSSIAITFSHSSVAASDFSAHSVKSNYIQDNFFPPCELDWLDMLQFDIDSSNSIDDDEWDNSGWTSASFSYADVDADDVVDELEYWGFWNAICGLKK